MELVRGVDADFLQALQGPFHPVLFVYMDWPDHPVYAHSGVGSISWDGHDWTGVSHLGSIDLPAENMGGVVANEATISLAGVPLDLNGLVGDNIRGRMALIWVGVLAGRPGSEGGTTLIGEPVFLFAGSMDTMGMDISREDAEVSGRIGINLRTGPSARSLASVSHSDEDQRRTHPTDTAGRHVILAYAKAQKLKWPE